MTKIVAIYKFFNDAEWMRASVASVLPFVQNVIIAIPPSGWDGRGMPEECPVKDDFKDGGKVTVFNAQHNTQTEIYEEILNVADHVLFLDYDYLMLVDADEVWDAGQLENAIGNLAGAPAYTANMYSYIRSPFYRVEPYDPNHPVVFVKHGVPYSPIRWAACPQRVGLQAYFHHFSAVRLSMSAVMNKFRLSNVAEQMPPLMAADWVRDAWCRLPYSKMVNPNPLLAHLWKSVRVVGIDELPAAAAQSEIVQAFQASGTDYIHDCVTIPPEMMAKHSLPADFGPGHKFFRVPSFNAKWRRMMTEIREKIL